MNQYPNPNPIRLVNARTIVTTPHSVKSTRYKREARHQEKLNRLNREARNERVRVIIVMILLIITGLMWLYGITLCQDASLESYQAEQRAELSQRRLDELIARNEWSTRYAWDD